MTGRPKRTSLIRSRFAFRALITGVTFTAFTGMSAFAATHVWNPNAPLRPSAGVVPGHDAEGGGEPAAPTPAPTTRARITTTGRVPTTTLPPRTRAHSS